MYDTLISYEDENTAYIIPYIIDLQREFKLLKINNNQLILNHLTLITNKQKQEYKISAIRKFFKQNNKDIGAIQYSIDKYRSDRLYSPINNTTQDFSVVNILRTSTDNSKEMKFSDKITAILDLHKVGTMDYETLSTLKNYEIDFSYTEIIGVFMMLYLIDSFIKKTLERIKEEEFY